MSYDMDDIVTYYFILRESMTSNGKMEKNIKAWTDDKELAKYYMEFHQCPKYTLKKVTKPMYDMIQILEDNRHDEIKMSSVYTLDKSKNNYKQMKLIYLPLTGLECQIIKEEASSFFSGRVNYSSLNEILPYLKNSYQKALSNLLLNTIIRSTVHNKTDDVLEYIWLDELMILLRSFPDDFDK